MSRRRPTIRLQAARCGAACAALLLAVLLLPRTAAAQDDQLTLAGQARMAGEKGDWARAARLWKQVVEREPENPVALDGLVMSLDRLGQLFDGVPYLEKLVQLWPQHAYRIYQLGLIRTWRGDGPEGLRLIERAMQLDPQNANIRAGYADVLSYEPARQEEAERILRNTLTQDPAHIQSRRILARLLATRGRAEEARRVFAPLLEAPNPDAYEFVILGQIEQAAGNREAAIAAYRRALALRPDQVEAMIRLAILLQWYRETEAEALALYEKAVALNPRNEWLLTEYADFLRWRRGETARARQFVEQVLAQNPRNLRAKAILAQMQAYSGKPDDAMRLYDEVLAKEPENVPALRGKAELYNWGGRHRDALGLLERARARWPGDSTTRMEMARANFSMGRLLAARENIRAAAGMSGPYFTELRRDIERSLQPYFEIGYGLRYPLGLGLRAHRLEAAVSVPLNPAHRATFRFRPSLFETRERDANDNWFQFALDSILSDTVTTRFEIGARTFPGAPSNFDGGFEVRWRARPTLVVETGFRRQALEDSLTAYRGQFIAGAFRGQVHSNLAHARATYYNGRRRFDVSFGYTDGAYTGRNLDTNRRWGLDAGFGKILRGYQPYIRVGYGFALFNFEFDASARPGFGPPRIAAEYYSPRHFIINYGSFAMTHKLIPRLSWNLGGAIGVQTVKNNPFAFWDNRLASSVYTGLILHLNDRNVLFFDYGYQDTFNAFQQHTARVSWRLYF